MDWLLRPDMYDEKRLQLLKSYQYRSVDKSPISRYVLRPYWEWVTRTWIPIWMAPNLVTLLGTSAMFLSFAIAVIWNPSLGPSDHMPRILHFIFAGCLWFYSTLDNVDGKQARRTGSSSPLGELFDHGCDSLVTGLGLITQLASLGIGQTKYGLVSILLAFWCFYLPTWEEYYTGVLHLGVINGPTEGILLFCAMYLSTGLFGSSMWQLSFGNWGHMTSLSCTFCTAAFFAFAVPQSMLNVYRVCRRDRRSFLTALADLLPMLLITHFSYLFVMRCHVQERGFLALFLAVCTIVFGKLATGVVYAHLLRLPYPRMPALAWPLLFSPLIPGWAARPFLIVYFVGALLVYTTWVFHAILSFANYLGINCFSLCKQRHSQISRTCTL